jgi:hypothetical protein
MLDTGAHVIKLRPKLAVNNEKRTDNGGETCSGESVKDGLCVKPTMERLMSTNTRRLMTYYDLKKNWPKVRRHLNDKTLNDILVRDFNKFTYGRLGKPFTHGQVPFEFESCDWWLGHRGRRPAFWNYVKHSACHWLVNFTLHLAMLVKPNEPWRILTSDRHSTVWNGNDLLFDFNFQALGIDQNECFKLASGKELQPGEHLKCHLAQDYKYE